jgi:hypothetical protein
MIHTNYTRPHRTTTNRNGSRRAVLSSAGRDHASNFSDAVVATYIHDISVRNGAPRRVGGLRPAARRR